MDFLNYLQATGYHNNLLIEVINNLDRYIYKFKFKGKWQIAPKWELKILQKILKEYLTKYYGSIISENATAYIVGKNLSYNVSKHQGNSYFFVTDFKNFFPSIEFEKVKYILKSNLNKETEDSIDLILKIVFYDNKLQYGFPTSPIISNLILINFDKKIEQYLLNYFKGNNIKYSRYSDDITISAKYKINKNDVLSIIENLIDSEYTYLKLNLQKTRFFEKYSHSPYITGLVPLNQRISIGKKKFNIIKLNTYLILSNKAIENDNFFRKENQLQSYLNYLYLVDKHNYIKLKNYFSKNYIDSTIFNSLFRK
ncbi:reverse transcriptase domain-containing protein [Aliarcobacter butzleri]